MSAEKPQDTGGLSPQYQTYECQKCFVAYTEQTQWSDDLLSACQEVLSRPEFSLEPDYARRHFYPDVPLRQKALELIANARYGIYDLSYWRDVKCEWQMPCNVFIELGMAIALNRPTLLLRHASNRELGSPACLKSVSGHILEFSGETTLKRALEERLPQWVDAPPERDWWNRYCIFGGRICEHREAHPRARQWGQKTLHCHIADGPDVDRDDFRGVVEEVLGRFSDVAFDYLDALPATKGYDFLLCTHCQTVRSTPFAIYRITPRTPAETFIAIGMSVALEAQFEYKISKILLTENVQDVPSLLSGYEVVVARSDGERKKRLRTFIPTVMQKVRETAWKPRPLPFVALAPQPATTLLEEKIHARREMMAVRLYVANLRLDVSGEGYQPTGEFTNYGEPAEPHDNSEILALLTGGLLGSDAQLIPLDFEGGSQRYRMAGDPTEGALVVAAAKAGLWREEVEKRLPRVAEVPFDSERKRTSTIHRVNGRGLEEGGGPGYVAYVKGAPDVMLPLCNAIREDGVDLPFAPGRRQHVENVIRDLESDGLRALAVAFRRLEELPKELDPETVEQELVLIGVVALTELTE